MMIIESKFKETEIGLIPEDWDIVKVSNVSKINELNIDKTFKQEEIEYLDTSSTDNGQILEWQILNIKDAPSRAKRILRNNDIVISTVRPNLKHFAFMNNVKKNSIASTGYAVATPFDISPYFLYKSLTTDNITNYLSRVADTSTTTYPSFRPEALKELKIPFPPIKEQEKIAEVLGVLDERIELNRKMNKTLEQIAQAVFNNRFLNNKNNKIGKLKDIARIITGKRPINRSGIQTEEFDIPIIGANSIMGYTDESLFENENVIITGRVGTLGTLHRTHDACWTSDNALITLSDYPNFTYQLMKNIDFDSLNRGSTQPLITQTDLQNYPLMLPTNSEIEKYEKFAESLDKLACKNNYQIETLSQIRDSLLPRLMSGELRVR